MRNRDIKDRWEFDRPSWDDFFLGMAFIVAQKSHDAQTRCGCVLTDRNNVVLSLGYNGFPRGVDDRKLPNLRPSKYPWMAHSERNALANCKLRPENGIAYVTGQCCNDCIYALWQHGITKVVMALGLNAPAMLKPEHSIWFKDFIELTQLEIEYISPNFDWIKNATCTPNFGV